MRILHVLGTLDRGGVENWLLQVLRQIDRREHQFDFVVEGGGPYAYQAEAEALGARVIDCGSHRNLLRYGWRLLRALRRFGPYDCIHAHVHYYSGFPLALAALAGVPIRIIHSHAAFPDVTYSRRIYAWAMRRTIRAVATAGIAVSRQAADALLPEGWKNNDHWQVMPLGIDLEPFSRPVDRARVRQELGIPADAFVVGHVGSFRPEKNHLFLLDVARELVALAPDGRLLLVGDGPLRPIVEEKVRSLGLTEHVIFAGERPDIPRVMKGAMDAFLFPSHTEGLGLAAIEAQAAGLPCLISEGLPEECDAGVGLVFRASLTATPRDWAKRVLALRESRQVSVTMPAWVTIERSAENLIGFYQTLDVHRSRRVFDCGERTENAGS